MGREIQEAHRGAGQVERSPRSHDKGTYARPSSVTFEKFAEDWLAGRRQIRGSTESGYGSIINKQLVPRLGAIAVSALRFEHVDTAVSGMIEDELSSKTIHNTVTLLRTMLAGKKGPSALRRGFAFHDPTMGLELPPMESRQITPPTPEQVWALIGAAKELGGLGYARAAFTGVGETKLSRFDSTTSSGLETR